MTTINFEDVVNLQSLIVACQYDAILIKRKGKPHGIMYGVGLMPKAEVAKLKAIVRESQKQSETEITKQPRKTTATKAKKAVVK